MDTESESLFALTPVSFRYKKEMDPQGSRQYGLIAEDVAKVNPDLVVNDQAGHPATLRFLSIQGMMLNELLKEHRKAEQQQSAIAELKSVVIQQKKDFQVAIAEQRKEFEARLNQQEAKIRNVSDRIKMNETVQNAVADR